MAETDNTQTPLLLTSNDKKPHIARAISVEDGGSINLSSNKPSKKNVKSTTQLTKAKSSLNVSTSNAGPSDPIEYSEINNNTRAQAEVGNLKFLQNRWTDIKHNSSFIKWIKNNKKLVESKRKHCETFEGVNAVWDAIRYGYCKSPKMNYNPYVRTSLIRAAALSDNKLDRNDTEISKEDDEDSKNVIEHKKKELETVCTTLPIYNGGNDVRLRKCDRNTSTFALKQQEMITSWLTFEVISDKILTAADEFIGSVSIDLTGMKQDGQMYYTQLPLINKKNYSRQIQMKAEQEFERTIARDNNTKSKIDVFKESVKEKIRYQNVTSDDGSEEHENEMNEMVKDRDLNVTGVLHVKAIKKLIRKEDVADVFDENKANRKYNLEIEILAITNLATLQAQGMDHRSFYGGIFAFVLYLLFYAIVMFIAEINVSTGMNEYKESIWFALVTVTTLGYGDIYPQTPYSKVLNAIFISINVIIIAGFVANLLGYVVDAGEDALDHRMDHMMNGAETVMKNQEQIKQKKAAKIKKQKTIKHGRRKSELKVSAKRKHNRSKSEPVNSIVLKSKSFNSSLNSTEEEEKNEAEEKMEKAVEEAKAIEVQTTKATKVKLQELTKLDGDERKKFTTQIYVNVTLFIFTILFGFFTLGVAILLTGPNFLTNLPYFGYECIGTNDPFCELDTSAGPVFVDSLYFTIVSMTTVGYGDIYPKPGAGARILGSLFILFGTLMLVRLLDLVSGYMIWKQNVQKKKRNLGKLLTSSKEFFQFDIDENGSVDKYEFLVGMLIKLDIVDMQRIDEIMLIFHETDLDGNGFVERKELNQKIAEDHMKLKWGEDAWKEINKEWNTIKIQQDKIQSDKKKLKEQEKELKKQITKFQVEKKQWQIEKQTHKKKYQMGNECKEETQEPYEQRNDIDIIIDDDSQ